MTISSIESFIEGLIENTRDHKLDWKPLSLFKNWEVVKEELERSVDSIDFCFNSIRRSHSYYLHSGEGYVFLFEIYHGLPEVTSPEMDTVAIMVKINNYFPIDNLSKFTDDEQKQLRILQILIENDVDEKYTYNDILYDYLSKVLEVGHSKEE